MNIALVTPADTSCLSNPGWHMITAGIRWLVRLAVPEARFIVVDMLRDDPAQWAAAKTCDALLLCGNPRFSLSAGTPWWEAGIWQRLNQARAAGVRVIDAWGGACYPHADEYPDLDTMAAELEALPRTQHALAVARLMHGVIVRDALAQRIYERAGIAAELLPCSSWWAAQEFGVEPAPWHQVDRRINAVVLTALDGHDWAGPGIETLCANMLALPQSRGGRVVQLATTWADYVWARSVGLQPRLVTDAESLLRIYAQCNAVASFRVHASIPAASLGCAVATLAIDSRARLVCPFDLPWHPFTWLAIPDFVPCFAYTAGEPSAPAVQTLRRLLAPC